MNREKIDSVIRSLRRVNLQGSLFGLGTADRPWVNSNGPSRAAG